MDLMTWQDSYTVHVPEFDVQHKHLIALLNQLNEAMARGHGNDVLGKILHELVTYTKTHFRAEEQFMQKKKFPGYAAHKVEHDKFATEVLTFQQQFSEGQVMVSSHVLKFLRDWLLHHILQVDKQYGAFANAAH